MNKKGKIVIITGVGVIGLAILLLLTSYIINNKYRSRIPKIPDSSSISTAVETQLADALKKARRKPSAENLGELGMVFHSCTNYDQAAQCYQLAIEKNESTWIWNYYLGYLCKELGESDRVIENFERVIELNPNADLAWYYLGEAYRNLKKTELSEKAFSRIANKSNANKVSETTRKDNFPLSVYALFELSNIYIDNGHPEIAEETINKLLAQSDVFGPAYRVLASIYFVKGESTLGERFSARANDLLLTSAPVDALIDKLAMMSRSELFLLKLIDEAKNSGYNSWALSLVEQGLQYMPENEHLALKSVDIYLLNSLNQEAVNLATQHTNSFAGNYPDLMTLGLLFSKKVICTEAVKYWKLALKLKPEDVDIYKNLAMCFSKTGDKQQVQDILTEAAEFNRENAENLADIICAFFQYEETDKANEYLKKLKQQTPQAPKVQKLYGKVAERNGNLVTAIKMYESSFKGNPGDTETIDFLGNLLFTNKMWHKYITFCQEVLNHNPNDPDLLEKLSTFYIQCPDESLRNLEEGIIYSIRAFSHKHSTSQVKLSAGKNLAVALATIGDKQNALNILQKTIKVGQESNASQGVKQELDQLYQEIQNL